MTEFFTSNNTDGFTTEELHELNMAFDTLQYIGIGNDEHHVSDFLLNFYTPGTTAIQYVQEYLRQKGA